MTLAEQREKLIEMMVNTVRGRFTDSAWREIMSGLLAAISAAGYSIVGPEVTQELGGLLYYLNLGGSDWEALLEAGDLARKPE